MAVTTSSHSAAAPRQDPFFVRKAGYDFFPADPMLTSVIRRVASISLCLASLLAASGCGGSGDSDAVRLELWTLALRPTFVDYMERVCDEFEAAHPGVEVVWVDVPFDAINRKLVAAAASGRAPDVVNLSDRDFARFASLGALEPLDSYLPEEEVEEVYLPGASRALRLGGGQLGLPWYLTTSVRLVNEAKLAAGGLSTEQLADDWAGLRTQARAYHEATGGGFLFTLPLGESSQLPLMMLGEGVVPFRMEGDRLVADLSQEEVRRFVSAWVELYRDGVLPRAAATRGHEHLVEMYQHASVAMVQTGPNMLRRVQDANPEVFSKTAVLEPVVGAIGRSHIALMCVSVTTQSDHPKLAAELARHVTSAENQAELASRATIMPSARAALGDERLARPLRAQGSAEGGAAEAKLALARAISARSLRRAVAFTPALEAWPDLRRSFDAGIKSVLLEGADVGEALSRIEASWNRHLAARRPATLSAVPRPEPVEGPPITATERGGAADAADGSDAADAAKE